VDTAGDGESGLGMARVQAYDVIVLDIMLPKLDGMQVLQRLRSEGRPGRVIMLTARDAVADRVAGLRGGADDYLIKPFAFDELLARVESLARREATPKLATIRLGHLEIRPSAKTVHRDGEPVTLTPREYALLEFLLARHGEVVSRTQIEANIYDREADLMSNVVDSAICALRRKIDRPGNSSCIQTRRGHGYVLRLGDG
jgi:DNA-binding response OmpR family regulator